MRRAVVFRILSPLLFFVAHVIYLAIWSSESFFQKWIDGSFSFFLALVMCNIIRARVVAQQESAEQSDTADQGPGGAGGSPAP
jgi:hypothetical protein